MIWIICVVLLSLRQFQLQLDGHTLEPMAGMAGKARYPRDTQRGWILPSGLEFSRRLGLIISICNSPLAKANHRAQVMPAQHLAASPI